MQCIITGTGIHYSICKNGQIFQIKTNFYPNNFFTVIKVPLPVWNKLLSLDPFIQFLFEIILFLS